MGCRLTDATLCTLAKATNEPLKTDESTARRYPTATTMVATAAARSLVGVRAGLEVSWAGGIQR
eukprot:scaffold31797_cov63-Phaeocystis_antarctica.AAC.3